jgi:hypothetical protein
MVREYDIRGGRRLLDNDYEHNEVFRDIYTIQESDPLSAEVRSEYRITNGRGRWQTTVTVSARMTSSPDTFHVTNTLHASENGTHVFERTWQFAIDRCGV